MFSALEIFFALKLPASSGCNFNLGDLFGGGQGGSVLLSKSC